MSRIQSNKPLFIMLYGFPGAGKSHFSRQLTNTLHAVHINSDRIRHELFDKPKHNKQEEEIIGDIMQYMAEEFLKAGVSVIYDASALRLSQRRALRDTARKLNAHPVLIWVQIDPDSAFARASTRDRRKADDKHARHYDRSSFEAVSGGMQNPQNEDYIVISGKHTFNTQRSSVIKKLYELGLIDAQGANASVVKPGLINLIPNPAAGRVDISRRNIIIR